MEKRNSSKDDTIMLTAWAQTDFSWLQQTDREKGLEQRIEELEKQLAKVNNLARQLTLLSTTKQQQPSHLIMTSNHDNSNNSTMTDDGPPPSTSVINPLKRTRTVTKESVKYKIVPQGMDGVNVEPVEVRVTTEEITPGDNLNCSDTDSGRLVICVPTEDETIEMKTDTEHLQNSSIIKSTANSIYSGGYIEKTMVPLRRSSPDTTHSGVEQNSSTSLSAVIRHTENRMAYNDEAPSTSNGIRSKQTGILYNEQATTTTIMTPYENTENIPTNTGTILLQQQQQQQQTIPLNTPTSERIHTPMNYNNLPHFYNSNGQEMIIIGPNGTRIPSQEFFKINWDLPAQTIRKLLMCIFDRHTLATHSLTGRPSPAFKGQNKPIKERLDQSIIDDIIALVVHKCKVSVKEVRSIITTKCADENKMMKLQETKRRTPMRELNENSFEDAQ